MPRPKKKLKSASMQLGKTIAGTLLLVPAMVVTVVLFQHLRNFQLASPIHLALITGAGVYLVMHLLLWKPIFIHVMGHELTHAFWAVLLGGKIKSLLVSHAGGQVTLSKTNFIIALAPYFFPLYTFLILPIYFIAAPKYYPILAFLIGFSLLFHIALTLHSMQDHQSDIVQVGVYFSLIFVYVMNFINIVLILSVITPDIITIPQFLKECGEQTLAFIKWGMALFASLRQLW